MSTARYVIGDTFDGLAMLKDEGITPDLIFSSPPFLALRSYLPPDHPDKGKEIGSEPDPASFLSCMLDVVEACAEILSPTGTLAFEFGDTYSGSGGAGGDYADDGLRDGQAIFRQQKSGGWPMAKSLCMIPELFAASLAYGRNLLDPERTTDPWRIRNTIAWVRPNPPVGALGDKFRPAKSLITVAAKASDRWFDLDAVRTPTDRDDRGGLRKGTPHGTDERRIASGESSQMSGSNPAGAPPLDWWKISPGGYRGEVKTTRRVPCGPGDGGERTTSPDCPVHAGLPGQLPKALRDARAGSSSTHTARTDGSPDPELPLDSEATDANLGRSGSSPSPTTGSLDPRCSPVATPRSTASSRTGPAPATTSPDTASGRSSGHTADTSESRPSGEPHPGNPESRTSGDATSGSPTTQSPDRTAGTGTEPASSSACCCSFTRLITESTSHYAVFPPELLEKPIEAMCPRRVCRTCGKPSRREVDVAPGCGGLHQASTGATIGGHPDGHKSQMGERNATTTGWSSCGCPGTDGIRLDGYHTGPGWRPGIVLDPFGGTGTTALVATGRGRDAILLDLDERNVDLARDRLGMFLTDIGHATARRVA